MKLAWLGIVAAVTFANATLAAEVGIDGTKFTIDGKPVFLLGCSYYGALGASEQTIRKDLDELQRLGFNWIRVWATWGAFGEDVSAVDAQGKPREPFLAKLKWLVRECDRSGMLVDVTLSRGNGVTGQPRLEDLPTHRAAVATLLGSLSDHRNWWIDLSNERNIKDKRFTSIEDLAALRAAIKKSDPRRLVTASHAGELSRAELNDYLNVIKVDFLSLHRPRNAKSPAQTENRTREILEWSRQSARIAPLHYDEPFRRGYADWNPKADDFLLDLQGARHAGAAGWCFHNGDQRNASDGRPRRSFDLRQTSLFEQLDAEEIAFLRQLQKPGATGR